MVRLRTEWAALACFTLPVSGLAGQTLDMDAAGIVGRSDIILQRPNLKAEEAMPLGNGGLGLAVWGEHGLTIQLNRIDTLPGRLSPGQVIIPGLTRLTQAADYQGRLDLFNGEFREQGGGLSATVYVEAAHDVARVEVRGADPNAEQSLELTLWEPRAPRAASRGALGVLSETWLDSKQEGASGRTFGSLAAVTVQARDVHAQEDGGLREKISFRPNADGSYTVLIASPEWKGGDALETAKESLAAHEDDHRRWWNDFWRHTGLMKLHSPDGTAEYFENLRTIDLFTAAAERGRSMPGSQAGVADLFSAFGDFHRWDPAAYWHWNLRMQVAANIKAGQFSLNEPYFRLYRDNLQNIENWTKARMVDRPGACVPETMRFNGQGFENETWTKEVGRNCDAGSPPYYNARTLSTGAEVSFWIWQQYLATRDDEFLRRNYPVMAASARFLLAYSQLASDKLRHTSPSNAHENQWDVRDPVTDLCAMRTLFPALIEASKRLHLDAELANAAQVALKEIPELPRTTVGGDEVVAQSYEPGAKVHNSENLGLEPVWPYSLIGDEGPLHDLAVRTYKQRPNKVQNDWNYDPIQAARLGLADEVKSTLIALTEKYQAYPSGLAAFFSKEFYGEQIGVLADALEEALVQDYDGLIRIAPAWPKDWEADGVVYGQQNTAIGVEIRQGRVRAAVLTAGYTGEARLRDPWPDAGLAVFERSSGSRIRTQSKGRTAVFAVTRGKTYLLQPAGPRDPNLLKRVSSVPGSKPKSLGQRSIGLWK